MTKMWLQEKSWQDVEDYLKSDDRIIIPVGSTEQHGSFAPLGTDTYAAIAIAEGAGEKAGVLTAPPLWFGWSPHHLVRPGTISVRAEVLIEVLYDVITSLAEHGFKAFIIINGHRIVNIPWMQIASERAQRKLGVKVVIFDPAYMSKEIKEELGFGPIGHAEEIEISHMLYRHPDLVNLNQAKSISHKTGSLYYIDPSDPRDTLCYVPVTREDLQKLFEETGDTVVGHPDRSSLEKGKVYHDHLVGRLLEVLAQLKKN